MQVARTAEQHAVMTKLWKSYAQVIVSIEIGTELEAAAARTIAERGVQLVATAHGNTLGNLLVNPTLSDLLGGIQTVTLGDEEARRRHTQKSILERKAPLPLMSLSNNKVGKRWSSIAMSLYGRCPSSRPSYFRRRTRSR